MSPEESLRREVAEANRQLPRLGLVVMHSGNVSGFLPEMDLIFIKPSGMNYDDLTSENLAMVQYSTGRILSEGVKPSVDLPHHLFLYRHRPELRGIVHTHSNYATAFASVGASIPCCLTAIADEFGGDIPCAPYVDNEGDHIGQSIIEHSSRAPAVLLRNHGVFAWGDCPMAALKAAAMTEDAAKTVWLAMQIGSPQRLAKIEIEKWHDRYQNRYGQV